MREEYQSMREQEGALPKSLYIDKGDEARVFSKDDMERMSPEMRVIIEMNSPHLLPRGR